MRFVAHQTSGGVGGFERRGPSGAHRPAHPAKNLDRKP
jgi:hypothetical protein